MDGRVLTLAVAAAALPSTPLLAQPMQAGQTPPRMEAAFEATDSRLEMIAGAGSQAALVICSVKPVPAADVMPMKTVLTEVRKMVTIVAEVEPEQVTDEANLWDDVGIDSLMAMELQVGIEKKFKVDIPEDEFCKNKTVVDLAKCVHDCLIRAKANTKNGRT